MAAVNDWYEVRMVCVQGDQASINVRHYKVQAVAGTGQTDAQIAANLAAFFAPDYKQMLASNASFRGVGVRRIMPQPIGVESSDIASAGPGTAAGDCLPRQTAHCLSLRTAFGGKRYRGRFYIPFPAEGNNDPAGIPDNAYMTMAAVFGAALTVTRIVGAGGNTVTLVPHVYSRSGSFMTPLLSVASLQRWATIRSRGSWGRPNTSPF